LRRKAFVTNVTIRCEVWRPPPREDGRNERTTRRRMHGSDSKRSIQIFIAPALSDIFSGNP
jgi:hypothetical protein